MTNAYVFMYVCVCVCIHVLFCYHSACVQHVELECDLSDGCDGFVLLSRLFVETATAAAATGRPSLCDCVCLCQVGASVVDVVLINVRVVVGATSRSSNDFV